MQIESQHTRGLRIKLLLCFVLLLFATRTLPAAFQVSGFREELWLESTVSSATGMAWAPDGSDRLFILGKEGAIRIVRNGLLLSAPFATVSPLYTQSECGLIGICFDPNFTSNGFLYVFATVSGSEQQIIRYRAVGDTGTEKTVIVPGLPTKGANHDGGGIGIGADGKLYWSIGDQGDGTGVNANLSTLASKVGRANRNGTVPSDNPFVDGPGGNNDFIWARGFRNPFTLTFQPATGDLWVNCVGNSYEQIFLVRRGDQAGWITYENNQPPGYIRPRIKYRTNGADTRSITGTGAARSSGLATFATTSAHGFRPGEKLNISGVNDNSFNGSYYVHSIPGETVFTVVQAAPDATSGGGSATTLNQGGSVTGGAFYNSTQFPAEYRGNFFYGDFNSDRLMRATLNESNEVTSVDYFANNLGAMIDVSVGPDGALYLLNYGGDIRRITYTNSSAGLVVTPTTLYIDRGGISVVDVSLGGSPASPVTVSASIVSGGGSFLINGGASLNFSAGNFAGTQPIIISANGNSPEDGVLRISAPGYPSVDVSLRKIETTEGVRFAGIRRLGNGVVELILTGTAGDQVVTEASHNLISWQPISTNTLGAAALTVTDASAAALNHRFYRTRRP